MNYNPTPRTELLKNTDLVQQHHVLVENEILRTHLRLALQEMQVRATSNTPADNFNACAAAHLRMLGAQDFLDIFLNMAETETTAPRKDVGNLPGNVATLPRQKN